MYDNKYMGCMSQSEYDRLVAELEKLEELYNLAVTTYEGLLQKDISEYRFDSGEGSQRARRVRMAELSREIEWISSRADNIRRKLSGKRLVNIVLRRKVGFSRHLRYRTW